jgi:hypothetical protein
VVIAYEDELSLASVASGEWTRKSGQDRHSLIIGDPETALFVDCEKHNFKLRRGSPAIDSGAVLNAPGDDFEGNARPVGNGIDRGAYEWKPDIHPSGKED